MFILLFLFCDSFFFAIRTKRMNKDDCWRLKAASVYSACNQRRFNALASKSIGLSLDMDTK